MPWSSERQEKGSVGQVRWGRAKRDRIGAGLCVCVGGGGGGGGRQEDWGWIVQEGRAENLNQCAVP